MLQIGLKCQLELATIAAAYVYFEKIVLKQIINKQNRKIVAANCLIIAAKLHDVKGNPSFCILRTFISSLVVCLRVGHIQLTLTLSHTQSPSHTFTRLLAHTQQS